MRYRILAGIAILLIFAAGIFGLSKRQSYTDLRHENHYLDQLQVAELPERLTSMACQEMEKELSSAAYIMCVQVLEDMEYLPGAGRMKVLVQEIYRGDGLRAGDKIYLTGQCTLNVWGKVKSLECHFVNLPQPGHEYLVFAEERVDALNEAVPVYRLYFHSGSFVAPVFCYEDFPHTIVPTNGESTYVPYVEVGKNEFFSETEDGFQMWSQLKKQLIARYPYKK